MATKSQSTDTLFSPLVSLDSSSVNNQVEQTTQGSHDILARINEIDAEEKVLYTTLLKVSDDIRQVKEVQQQDSSINANTKQTLTQEMVGLLALQTNIKSQIESLGKMRIQLYKDLGERYIDLQTVVGESRNDLVDQKTVSDIMGNELSDLQQQYGQLSDERNRKSRLTEIDTYYGKRYQSYSEFMKLIAYVCIPLLAVAVIFRMNYISDGIRSGLVMLVLVIGGYFVFLKGIDIWYRDNMNWDEYKWPFSGNNNEGVWEFDKRELNKMWGKRGGIMDEVSKTLGFACVNEACCSHPHVTWDKSAKMCVMKKKSKKHTKQTKQDDIETAKAAGLASTMHTDGFTPMHAAPFCHPGKSLGAQVNESCGVACDLGNLAQNYCGGAVDGSVIDGFDGF